MLKCARGLVMTEIVPRGIRLNNPLNIRLSKTKWQGQATEQKDESFVTFSTPVMGLRAAMRLLQNYQAKYDLLSVWEMISRWAPPKENDTGAYALNVAKLMGVDVNDDVDIIVHADAMIKMVKAMVRQENGHPENFPNWIHKDKPFWYDDTAFISAWNLL